MIITMHSNARQIARGFRDDAARVAAAEPGIVAAYAAKLKAAIQTAAPVEFGEYRDSWRVEMNGSEAEVGTDEPQGYRLELGFHGTDALGRDYNQPPQPHVEPAFDAIGAEMVLAFEGTLPK